MLFRKGFGPLALEQPLQPKAIINTLPFYEQLLMTHIGFMSPITTPRSKPCSKDSKAKNQNKTVKKVQMPEKSGFIFFERFCMQIC